MDFRDLGYGGFLYDDLYTLEDHFRYTIKELKENHDLDITPEHLELFLAARDITIQRKIENNERVFFRLLGSFTSVLSKSSIFDIYNDLMFKFEEDNARSPGAKEQNSIWHNACKFFINRLYNKKDTNFHKVYYDLNPRTGKLRKRAAKYAFSLSEQTIDITNDDNNNN